MGFKYSIPTDGAKLLMLFFGEGQLRDRGLSLAREGPGPSVDGWPAEDKTGEAVVKLRTPVWCRPKALRCLSQLGGSKSRRFAQSSGVGLCASCCDDGTCLLFLGLAVRSFGRWLSLRKSISLWQGRRHVCLGVSHFGARHAWLIMITAIHSRANAVNVTMSIITKCNKYGYKGLLTRPHNLLDSNGHEFVATEKDWGFPLFIRLSELCNHDKGYLVNDTCIFEAEAEVSVHNVKGKILKDPETS
ncbi:unnamed protein product [Prunus armeniaca]